MLGKQWVNRRVRNRGGPAPGDLSVEPSSRSTIRNHFLICEGCWIRRVGCRSRLPSMKSLLRILPLALAWRGACRGCGLQIRTFFNDSTHISFAATVSSTILVVPIEIIHPQTPLRGMTTVRDRSTNIGRGSHPFKRIGRFGAG